MSHVYTSLSLSLSVFLSNTYIKLLCNFEFFNKNVSILLLRRTTTPSTIYQTYKLCEHHLILFIEKYVPYMTIYVVVNAFSLYRTSCWQICTPNSTFLFQKFSLSKHVTFLHLTNHSSWERIKTFKNIINNAATFNMVRTVAKLL
jgi:hypothetical protein